MIDDKLVKLIIEAALFAAEHPLTIENLLALFPLEEQPHRSQIHQLLEELQKDYAERGIELVQLAKTYRFQTKLHLAPWLKRLWSERTPRYSRALLETLAIIAYRQPITRTEIEAIRGISVSTEIVKKLQDYNWIRILAHRETPGHPALYGTTREFLQYFNLKSLNDLPTLLELREVGVQMELFQPDPNTDESIDAQIKDETPEVLPSQEADTERT